MTQLIAEIDGATATPLQHHQAKLIAEKLHQHYPGHLWAVQIEQGLANIYNLALSGRWGFTVHLRKIDADYKTIVRAGGELLERYRLSRGKLNIDEFDGLARNRLGDLEFDK